MANSTVVFVTGVGKGIGRAVAQIYLLRRNHTVIGSVRDGTTPEVADLKSSLKGSDTKLLIIQIESTSVDDPKKALFEIEAAGISHIDVLIANAGGYPPAVPLDTVDRKDLMSCFEVNAAAPLLLFQTFQHLLRKAKSPKWIVISTTAGSIGQVGDIGSYILPAYGASKAALNWLNQSIHFTQEWLTVMTLHPGLVQTGQGTWVAQQFGLKQAPTTIETSSISLVKVVSVAMPDRRRYTGGNLWQVHQRD